MSEGPRRIPRNDGWNKVQWMSVLMEEGVRRRRRKKNRRERRKRRK